MYKNNEYDDELDGTEVESAKHLDIITTLHIDAKLESKFCL